MAYDQVIRPPSGQVVPPAGSPAAAPLPVPAPSAPAAPAYASGWGTGPGGMVKHTATGQLLPENSPEYQRLLSATAPSAPSGGQPAAPIGPQTTQDVLIGTQAPAAPPTVAGAFQTALMNKLAPEAATAQSAEIQPALQANRLSEQRGFERDRAMNAERNAAQGTNNSGGANTELLGLSQDRTAREGQFAGQAVQDLGNRNNAAQLAMAGLAGGMLQNNDAQALQRYGIDTGRDTSMAGINAQSALGGQDLALRKSLGEGQLNLSLAGLLQGGQQFGQSLSNNQAQFGAGLNQQALLAMLGGL